MKKVAIIAALVLFCSFGVSYGAEAEQPKQEVTPKEFISAEMPDDVMVLLFGVTEGEPVSDKALFSGKTSAYYDYLLREFSTNLGKVWLVVEFQCSLDQKRILMPWTCQGEQVVIVFVDQKVAWYKSEAVKILYQTATK